MTECAACRSEGRLHPPPTVGGDAVNRKETIMRTGLRIVVVMATVVMIDMPGLRLIPASPRDPCRLRSGGFGNSAGLNDGLSCLV